MLTKAVPFTLLALQGRWKVEFFCADENGRRRGVYDHVRLADVLTDRRERLDPQQFPNHTFNYIGLEHVQSITGDLINYAPRPGREILSVSKVFRKTDLLYGRLRPSLNKVFIADESVPHGICSGEFHVLTPDQSRILPCFARAVLASAYVQDVVGKLTTGSALPRLHLQDLLAIEVPLPPLKVQRKYERELVAEQNRRRVLARELADRPRATLTALANSLESGEAFKITRFIGKTSADYCHLELPGSVAPNALTPTDVAKPASDSKRRRPSASTRPRRGSRR